MKPNSSSPQKRGSTFCKLWIPAFSGMTLFFFLRISEAIPPEMAKMGPTGTITGKLLKDGRTPVHNHPITLEVFNGPTLILTLPKETDNYGKYSFKNIFQSTSFSYAISTDFEGKTYRTNPISLNKGEAQRNVDLLVGKGAQIGETLEPQLTSEELEEMGEESHRKPPLAEYQFLAILLTIGAVAYAFYQFRKRRNP